MEFDVSEISGILKKQISQYKNKLDISRVGQVVEVGDGIARIYGLEGAIPDVVAKRLIREVIAPHFLANDFYGGISDGARTLMKLIDGEKLPPPAHSISSTAGTSTNSEDYQSIIAVLLVVAVVAGGILKAIFGRLVGSALTGVAAGIVAWLLAGAIGMAFDAHLEPAVFLEQCDDLTDDRL